MAQAKTWAAFDVHLSGVVAAVLERDSGECGCSACPEVASRLPTRRQRTTGRERRLDFIPAG
jgi:hypothetical protein